MSDQNDKVASGNESPEADLADDILDDDELANLTREAQATPGRATPRPATSGSKSADGDDDADGEENSELAAALKERDEYLEIAQRVQAEFENYKRRVEQQRTEQRERAAESLAIELLPVLDAGEAARAQNLDEVDALFQQLLLALEKQGLERVAEADVPFDPEVHEAVLHEEGDADNPMVVEIMRTGYLWNKRVIRPAMVKVSG